MGGLKRKSSSSAKALAKSKKKKGPHLPNSILKVIANQKRPLKSDEEDDDDVLGSDDEHGGDLYEYEEGVPEEESRKNNRYDRHDNYDYELPDDFEVPSEFQPRTEFEKKMASVLNDSEVSEAHRNDGARLLELNEVSMEDHIKDHNHIAKMRSLLFRHEFKSKRIKKIKSKTYHRLKNKDLKNSSLGALMDPEMAKEEAMRQEAKRVEERMTLKHRNTGKWAKRMISRGLNVKYDGPKAAIAEQLQMNANLSRKMNSMRDGSSSDESDDEEELNDGADEDTPSRLIAKAKEKTLKALEDDEVPNAGLMSLPFMARAMKKKNEEANEEAKRALEEYEEWENSGGENSKKTVNVSGRRVFGATAKVEAPKESRKDSDNFYDDSDSDNDMAGIEDNNIEPVRDNASPARNTITETEKFDDDVAGNPASKTTFDVAMFASGSWKKMAGSKNTESKKASRKTRAPIPQAQDKKGWRDEESEDSESEAEQMVDGVLTSTSKETFEVPSQAELINRAFAGDDVLDEFEKDKEEVLNQEVPKPEKPVLVPGWGDWTNIQKKRGISKQMVQKHEAEKKEWEQGLKTRKDARLKHVIISEKVDKKAEKLHTTTLPFPFTSKEVFEHSMRMPIGPEFNPSTIVGELNRPEVVKKTGVIIKPVKFEEVNPNDEVDDEHPRNHQKQRPKKKTSRRQGKVKSK
ncbi:hypothetical protein BRARA_B02606 [Brassica rapa]|uniref:Uncharacterized protein n=1 Tax=Brassica campestris TaxID=3711 RepID=A0A398ACR6_BRACM|nr:hypothetical protein BRARA_B02606 [Brassica rapa]